VLAEHVASGDLSEPQAVDAARRLFFGNANELYRLGLEPAWEETQGGAAA
jgi:hypothetical protein